MDIAEIGTAIGGAIGDIMRNKSIFKKKTCILIAVVMLTTVFVGCTSQKTVNDKELTVYYVKGTSYYSTVLDTYDNLDDNVKLNCVEFQTEDEMTNKLATEMAAGAGPDVVLLSSKTTLDIDKSIKGDNFADLTSNFADDSSYSADNYFKNIIDGVEVSGKQYIVPLTFDLTTYNMKKSVRDKLQLGKLDTSLNYGDFMNTVLSYQEQLQSDDNMELTLSAMSSNGTLMSTAKTCGLKVIDENGQICISKNDFQLTFSIIKSMQNELLKKQATLKANATGREAYGYYDTYFYKGNIATETAFLNAILSGTKFNDSLVFQGIPNIGGDGGYNANVTTYGVVNSKSINIQQSYKLLRFMMDYNFKSEYINECFSINKIVFADILDKIKLGYEKYTISSTEQYTSLPWDNELSDSFNYMMEHITTASVSNSKVWEIIQNIMQGYLDGTDSFDTCYDKMINQLNLYLQE